MHDSNIALSRTWSFGNRVESTGLLSVRCLSSRPWNAEILQYCINMTCWPTNSWIQELITS